jgi:predicted Zn-dependent protease
MTRRAFVRWALFIAALPAAVGLSGCSSTKKMFKPSVEQQKQVGDQAAKEVTQQYKVVSGPDADRVRRVGERLVSKLPADIRQTWSFDFNVVDSKDVNAFALPGGHTYVFTGLLSRMKTDDEIAAVLGHEMAHVYEQHWAEQVAADQERSAGLSVLLGALNADKGWYTAAGVLNTVVNLRYSRKDEDEADADGLQNMYNAGFDPNGMLQLFQTLQQASGSGGTPAFLSDHPLTSERIKRTEERIAKLKAQGSTGG